MRFPIVLITGGNGRLGQVLREALPEHGWHVRTLDVRDVGPSASGSFVGSVTDLELMRRAATGVSAIVHLAGLSDRFGHDWQDYLAVNIDGTRIVLEAARLEGVGRVVLASSGHAVGFTARQSDLPDATPARPDTAYGVSKVAMEALGSLYADEYGMQTISLRIGSCEPRPREVRTLSIWLSHADLVSLTVAALTAQWVGHRTVWGASRNTRRWWSYAGGDSIGFDPRDDSELWAADVSGVESRTVGGAEPRVR